MSNEVATTREAKLRDFLAAAKSSVVTDPQQAMLDIIGRVLEADTISDVLGQSKATHAKDVLGEPLELHGVRFQESTLNGAGPDFYALLDVVKEDGTKDTITCGAATVMAQAYRLAELGALPLWVKITEAERETSAGFRPMALEAVPTPF